MISYEKELFYFVSPKHDTKLIVVTLVLIKVLLADWSSTLSLYTITLNT